MTDGTAGQDFMTGGPGADTLNGLGGDDRINGNPGADTMNGGDGNDLIYDGILTFSLGDGSYTHSSDQFGDTLSGGNGDDQLFGSIGDSFHGGSGFDRMTVSLNSFSAGLTIDMRIVQAGGTINIPGINNTGSGYIVVPNGAQISGIEQVVSAQLTMGADTFWGTTNADTVDGYDGNDTLNGLGGDDVLNGGQGTNTLDGGDGNDQLSTTFGGGTQLMFGGAGDDVATIQGPGSSFDGGDGFDRAGFMTGGGTIDLRAMDTGGAGTLNNGGTLANVEQFSATAFSGDLVFHGSNGAETVTTFSGQLTASGGGGNDTLSGGFSAATNDLLLGEAGNDTLNGNGGHDALDGGFGDDVINGGDGNDVIAGERDLEIPDLPLSGEDTLSGGAGDDIIFGGSFDDTISGGDGDDRLFQMGGRAGALGNMATQTWPFTDWGADIIDGGAGFDEAWFTFNPTFQPVVFTLGAPNTISVFSRGGAFAGSVTGVEQIWIMTGPGDDILTGGQYDDFLDGQDGDNVLTGLGGNDTLSGSFTHTDILTGGTGDDRYQLRGGDSTVIELTGEGHDTIVIMHNDFTSYDMEDFENVEEFNQFSTIALTVTAATAGSVIITGIGNDTLIGRGGDDDLTGQAGDDILVGNDGDDWLSGGLGANDMRGGAGDDRYVVSSNSDTIVELAGEGTDSVQLFELGETIISYVLPDHVEDAILSTQGDLTFTANAGNNVVGTSFSTWALTINGLGGDDRLTGGSGDDILQGGSGTDFLNGEVGRDTVSAADDVAGVTIHLAGAWAQDGWGTFDTVVMVEDIVGSAFNDTLVGNAVDNSIAGGAGDDWIVGLDGNDVLEGGLGVNVLSGGAGYDLASYASATTGLWVNMAAGVYSAAGVWDVFFESIEGVRGGAGNDSLFGDASGNILEGGLGDDALIGGLGNDLLQGDAGSDWLVGGDGADWLIGGDGVDVLTGGAGADIFILGTSAGWDVAFDFNTAEDQFSLGGLLWLGFLTIDADGDGQTDDTLLGYAGGNFVALNVSGLTLGQWNALVDGGAAPVDAEKVFSDPDPEVLPAVGGLLSRDFGGSWTAGFDADRRGFRPDDPFLAPAGDWGAVA